MSKNNVLVFSEQSNRVFSEHLLQLLTKARELAKQLNVEVDCICYGNKLDFNSFPVLGDYGADNLYNYSFDKEYNDYRYFADVLTDHVEKHKPQLVLVPANSMGKMIASVLSIRFGAGLTADCIDVRLSNEGDIIFSRAALNDSVIADISGVNTNMVMGTVKKDAFKKEKRQFRIELVIHGQTFCFEKNYKSFSVLEQMPLQTEREIDLDTHDIVFCLGRGVTDIEVVNRFYVLSQKLNVGVAATRTLVEKNFISKAYQVGQSGKGISPKVYVGFGVSGASQHIVGIKNAEMVVAVNTDTNANITNYADYIIYQDLHLLLDEMESRSFAKKEKSV